MPLTIRDVQQPIVISVYFVWRQDSCGQAEGKRPPGGPVEAIPGLATNVGAMPPLQGRKSKAGEPQLRPDPDTPRTL